MPGKDQTWMDLDMSASADSICNKLSDGTSDATITFGSGGGSDTTAKLSLPKGSDILSATFKVSGLDDGSGNYPSMVKVDVGDNGDPEWEFNLSSIGSMGKQTEFIGAIHSKSLILNTSESDNSLKIRLPRSANILSASLNVEGLYHGIFNGDLETGTMAGWNIARNSNGDTIAVQNSRGGDDPPVPWGATNYYLMLRSLPFGLHDGSCDIIITSNVFPKLFTQYITMDWDMLDKDDFDLLIRVDDDESNSVEARRFGFDNDNVLNTESLTKQVTNIQSLTGSDLNIYLRLEDGGWWWNNLDNWGRLSVDNVYISDAIGNKLPDYPTNVSIDVGNDGTKEYNAASLTGLESVTGLKAALTSLLTNPSPDCKVTVDKYGNEFLDIPLNVTIRSSQGMLNITDLEIVYEYEGKVDKHPGGTLADELNSLIPSSGAGNVMIPIAVWSSTAGKLKISDINIQFNEMPTTSPIPPLEIDEDSSNPHKLDLHDHFSDDSSMDQLQFEIAQHSDPDKLEAIIEDDHYLSLNANQETDWYGDVTLTVRATDNHGLMIESNQFTVEVSPVNDEPRVNVPLTRFSIWEDSGQTTVALDDIPYFFDVEGDILYYSVVVDPDGVFEDLSSNFIVSINPDNHLVIVPNDDWYGYNIPVVLYCDDDNDPIDKSPSSPHQQFLIDVQSINDPPILKPFDTIFLDEDESVDNYQDLEDMASDVESATNKLKFSIMSNDNEENILVTIDGDNMLDITILTLDYVGSAKIKLQVMDEDFATAEESFKIIINSKNDGPKILQTIDKIQMLEDTIDSTSLNLYDIFYDPDSPITFSVIGNEHIVTTISQDSGSVTFKPDKDWFGLEEITFSAIDTYVETGADSQKKSITLEVEVLPVNDMPSTPQILSPQEPRANPADANIVFISADAFDVDSPDLKYLWDFDNRVDSDGDGDPTNDLNGIGQEVRHNYSISGHYYVTLYVFDGEFNCSPPAGLYVKVTTDIVEATEDLVETTSTFESDMTLYIPIIIIIIILLLLIFLFKRKDKLERIEDKDKNKSKRPERSEKPAVFEGELVSEPKLVKKASLPQTTTKPELPKPAAPVSVSNLKQTLVQPQPSKASGSASAATTGQPKTVRPTPTPAPTPAPKPTNMAAAYASSMKKP